MFVFLVVCFFLLILHLMFLHVNSILLILRIRLPLICYSSSSY